MVVKLTEPSIQLFEGRDIANNESDGRIPQGYVVGIKALTDNPTVNMYRYILTHDESGASIDTGTTNDLSVASVNFIWIDPNNVEARNVTIPLADGEASDTFTPNQVGTWQVVAKFSDGTTIVKELYVPFQVVPESIIGAVAVIGSSLAVLTLYRRERAVNNSNKER